MSFFSVHKKIHWSDADPAGIAWFPNYLVWFEQAEEELFRASLDETREGLLERVGCWLPRVEVHVRYEAPVRMGDLVRVGIAPSLEHARRLRYGFQMTREATAERLAFGFVRVACVDRATFAPRDFPAEMATFVDRVRAMAEGQARGEVDVPWA